MAFLVSNVLGELSSIIIEEMTQEVRLVVGVEKEVGKLTNNFRAIQAVLADAEKRQSKEATVKHWLDQLIDISYDIDDVLDEWSTAIVKSQIGADEHPPKHKRKVCSLLSFSCFGCCEVGLRHDIAHKIKELNERLDVVAKEKDNYNFNMETGSKQPERQMTASVIDLSEIKGRELDKQEVIDVLLSRGSQGPNPHPHVISIVGMGGIGKTTLAQLAYNDDEVKRCFDKRIWVCVSDPFDEIRVASAILESILGFAPNLHELENMLQYIHQSIDGKRFLLVLDDVWSDDSRKWKQLNNSLKSGLFGSKILVTTRKESVARAIGSTNIFQLGLLSTEESWLLFSQIALNEMTSAELEKLEEVGRKIVGKCKGLPLTLRTLGGMLQFRNNPEEWQTVLDSDVWELEETERYILAPLWLSYYDLSLEMRQCFSYCSIFPKDYILEKDKLINLWIAQGYLRGRESKEIEVIGQECFQNLATRSFFQDFERDRDGNIVKCKMHDMVHDFAQFLMRNECVSVEVNCVEERRMDSCGAPRHLLVRLENEAPFPLSFILRKLRSLLLESQNHSTLKANQANLFGDSISLRALKISNLSFTEVASDVSKLLHLRYLDFSHSRHLKVLPETICELCNLLFLDVRGCESLEKLPLGIGKLINLRHLKHSETRKLIFLPNGIGKLYSLRSLDVFLVSDGGRDGESCSLGDLKDLNHLRNGLDIRGLGNIRDVSEVEKAQLKNKKHINTLMLRFDGTEGGKVNDGEVLEALRPPLALECLKIEEYRGHSVFANWMISSINLKKVRLRNCRNCKQLPPLGVLPSLEFLEISSMPNVKKVGSEFLGIKVDGMENEDKRKASSSHSAFPKLKKLNICDMEGWEDWDFGFEGRNSDGGLSTSNIAIMPCLHVLCIERCPKLRALPDWILQYLKFLRILESPILNVRYNGGEDWHKLQYCWALDFDDHGWRNPIYTHQSSYMERLMEILNVVLVEI